MDEIKFVLKTFLATLLLIMVLQIKVGDQTIESRAYQMAARSQLTSFIGGVARGIVELGKQAQSQINEAFKKAQKPSP